MQNRLLDFYLLCSSSYKIVTNDLQTLQLPYKQRDWVVNHRHLIHRPKSSMLDSHKPWLIRLCSPTLLVAPCTDLLCKWTRLVLENPISSWPQSHRHSLFHYFVQREREREIWDILFFFLFLFLGLGLGLEGKGHGWLIWRKLFAFFPLLPYLFVGAFLFAFDDDIYLFFSERHRSYHLKDLKPWVLLQLQYKKMKEEGKNKNKK